MSGWQSHRGNFYLSFAAHVHAVQRRRIVTEAVARGITHFRMELPKARIDHVAPGGLTGRHLWIVRSLDEWREVETAENAKHIGSSAWDSLGLGFGDVSYLVPVPEIYLEEARAESKELRTAWLAKQKVTA